MESDPVLWRICGLVFHSRILSHKRRGGGVRTTARHGLEAAASQTNTAREIGGEGERRGNCFDPLRSVFIKVFHLVKRIQPSIFGQPPISQLHFLKKSFTSTFPQLEMENNLLGLKLTLASFWD